MMANVRRFDSDVSFNCIYADDGNLVRADEHLAAIAERDTTIERLRSEIAYLRSEIAYLDYFHREANFGPAHTDVVMAIQARYAEAFGVPVPEYWRCE